MIYICATIEYYFRGEINGIRWISSVDNITDTMTELIPFKNLNYLMRTGELCECPTLGHT